MRRGHSHIKIFLGDHPEGRVLQNKGLKVILAIIPIWIVLQVNIRLDLESIESSLGNE